jgi:hypothetical protein
MATRKNNWLNAKPVTKAGGSSGGTRNPAKPYNKPASTSGTPKVKTKIQKLQQAAKTKPSSPAPRQVVKKPVTRTGPVKGPVPPKGSAPVKLPNSSRAGTNLPKVGARAERTATAATQPRNSVKPQTTSSRPLTAADGRPVKMDAKGWPKGTESWADNSTKPSASTPKPAAKPSAAKSPLSRVGKAGVITMALGAANAADDARLTPAQLKKKYEVVDPNRGQRVADNLLGRNQTPKPKQGNAQSRFAGSRDANLNRINNDPRFAAPKPAAKPKPPTPTQSGGGSTQSRSGGGGSSRPAAPAPRRQPGPAADAGMKNQDKNYKGSYLQKFKEESGRMSAASMSRQQGRSNLTASDLKPKSEKTLREKMDELKKRRSGNSFGGL